MTENIQDEINNIETTIIDFKEKGNEAYLQFIKDSAACLKTWYDKIIEEHIRKNAFKVYNTNSNDLNKSKKNLLEFTNSFEKLISDSLDKSGTHWHEKLPDDLIDENGIDELIKKGFNNAIQQTAQKELSIAGNFFEIRTEINSFQWSKDMKKDIEEYKAIYHQAKPIAQKLKDLKDQQRNQNQEEIEKKALEKWRSV